MLLHDALIHYDREPCILSERRYFPVNDAELHPNHKWLPMHLPQLDSLLDHGQNVFGSSEDVNNVNITLNFCGDFEEAGVAFFA